ncbi:uncharacterized protein QC763_202100 [Podospora pseudopauciseta]|uniref:Cytochrome E-class, group IV n=3 Tax=Podospora TaxID=5144 RepID=A0ABY6S1Y1_PODCO|nr:hypothetical protein QC763_202100 [Podospora pseudopauciseta]KAK4679209.1 hypothetical protein QC764_202100 [Podospora pseudoanserina]VBB75250.1 Putative cytochrome E-class, group IV [Podospora comata]
MDIVNRSFASVLPEGRSLPAGGIDSSTFQFSSSIATAILCGLTLWYWWAITKAKASRDFIDGNYNFDAPIIGPKNAVLGRLAFFRNGPKYIAEGYAKYKDTFFKVSGNDLLIVPNKYLQELASMPPEKLSLNTAIVDAFQRLHSITNVITDHSLQTRMLNARLTPRLGLQVPAVQEQFKKYLPVELPANSTTEWTSINALHLARRMVHRGVATQFVDELKENEEYIQTAINYSEHGFKHNFALRLFPDFFKPIAAQFSPTSWGVDAALRKARKMLIPLIQKRRVLEKDPDYKKPEDFLQYLMDGGIAEGDSDEITVQRLMVTYLGSGPSTIIAVAQLLFDLCVHSEYVEVLREEIIQVLTEHNGFTHTALAEMKKLDSFMRESQRLSPPTLLGFNAIVRSDIVLHDGVVLPNGCHIQMATYAIGMDPEKNGPDPEKFDGLRQYNKRKLPGQEKIHRFTTTADNNLHFGHGKIVCPGRFFADHSMKMIAANILLRYDLQFPGGKKERPGNTSMYDVLIPDLGTCVEFRLREDAGRWNW